MTKPTKTFKEIMEETYKFADRDNAFAFANRAEKILLVMLGDDGRYWVTTPANCARLEQMGYQWAE